MSKVIIAVCDVDGTYGDRLGEWISLENKGKFQGIPFSSPDRFLEYQREQTPDVVLLGNGFWESAQIQESMENQKQGAEESPDIRKPLWMWLKEPQSEGALPRYIRELPAVDKYQPASRLLREVFSHYQGWGARGQAEMVAGKEVIGIYSPGHSIWQTPFALAFAQALGQREKVLYVNLKECAGFSGWFQQEYERDLLDVMYLCLSNEVNVSDCVDSARYSMEGIDFIPPAEDGGCLGEISPQDYVSFVKLLSAKSGYDVILLDFGMMIPGFYRLLELCSQVYITTEPGEIQEAPLQQFRQMTARQGDALLEQKLVYLSLPAAVQETGGGAARLQQWLWGVMGDFGRGLAGVQCGTD